MSQAPNADALDVRGLALCVGNFRLSALDLTVGAGEYVALMGRTGSGKTCLLEALCGLLPIESGTIRMGGRDVGALTPAERGIGYVPQDGALFSTMNVAEQLGFALRIRRRPRAEIEARVSELAGLLGLEALLHRRARGLSGGEGQRVALGRALACAPALLLLDEPLSALDEETREELCALLASVHERTGVSVLHVTHSRAEAGRLADRVLLLGPDGLGSTR